jgi:hypothetical protein
MTPDFSLQRDAGFERTKAAVERKKAAKREEGAS